MENANATLPQQSDGLNGYISSWMNRPADPKYSYGFSFYTNLWPLLAKPIAGFQIGLPGTWFTPENDSFTKPLCPIGSNARGWPDRAPTWNGVFQTMEGGPGFWLDTKFPMRSPKYRLAGIPDCYNGGVTSPSTGWGYWNNKNKDAKQLGIAQLSNQMLIPPDGITFDPDTNGKQFGVAYMALPIEVKKTKPIPTGKQAWTFFLNAKNFAGPLAFFVPNIWSKLSQNYPVIKGRGIDSRPVVMDSNAMEINTVPFFSATDKSGTTYTKLPQLQFPIDKNGNTILTQNVNFYSLDAFANPLQDALKSNTSIPTAFKTGNDFSFTPTCSADPWGFTQEKQEITGLNSIAQTYIDSKECTFGIHWKNQKNKMGYFPQYLKQVGDQRVAVKQNAVPAETNLVQQTFAPPNTDDPANIYDHKNIAKNPLWNKWVPNIPAQTAELSDGTRLTYRWYRFVDQPSIRNFALTKDEANALQALVVKLHKEWQGSNNFMPPQSNGDLVTLDPGQFVTPPPGLEYGYVPIVLKQEYANNPSSATTANETPVSLIFSEPAAEVRANNEDIKKRVQLR